VSGLQRGGQDSAAGRVGCLAGCGVQREEAAGEGNVVAGSGGRHFGCVVGLWGSKWCCRKQLILGVVAEGAQVGVGGFYTEMFPFLDGQWATTGGYVFRSKRWVPWASR